MTFGMHRAWVVGGLLAALAACRSAAPEAPAPGPGVSAPPGAALGATRLFDPVLGLTEAAVPDAALRDRLNAVHAALQRGDAGRAELVAGLSASDVETYVAALARVRREEPQDGHGQADLEWTFFAPELQPAGLRVLTSEMLGEARARDVVGIGVSGLAQMARDGPPESVAIFREIAAWPCAIDSGGVPFTTVVDKALAAAALTRFGTSEDAAAAVASLRACREVSADEHDRDVADRAEAALRSVPREDAAWRAWFEDAFGDELSSD